MHERLKKGGLCRCELSDLWFWKTRATGEKETRTATGPHKPSREGGNSGCRDQGRRARERVKLEYVEQGDHSGVPVILLHGFTDSWRSSSACYLILPASSMPLPFAAGPRGFVIALPRVIPLAISLPMSRHLWTLSSQARSDHRPSMGSHIAQRFALDYPDRTIGLVLRVRFYTFRGNPSVSGIRDAYRSSRIRSNGDLRSSSTEHVARAVPRTYLDRECRRV